MIQKEPNLNQQYFKAYSLVILILIKYEFWTYLSTCTLAYQYVSIYGSYQILRMEDCPKKNFPGSTRPNGQLFPVSIVMHMIEWSISGFFGKSLKLFHNFLHLEKIIKISTGIVHKRRHAIVSNLLRPEYYYRRRILGPQPL